jgi:hypothetical protein
MELSEILVNGKIAVIQKSHAVNFFGIEEMETQLHPEVLATLIQPASNVRDEFSVSSSSHPILQVDPEFQNLIPPLSSEEKLQLEANLQEFGCIDPLVVWLGTGILLDGHNRYEICIRLQIPYKIVEIEITDRAAAICWIANHQLGRRNITPETASYLRGKRYINLRGNREDNLKQNLPNGKNFLSVEDDPQQDLPKGKNPIKVDVAKSLAQQYKVSERTIRNDAQFTEALDTLVTAFGEEIKHLLLTRNTRLTKKDILLLAKVVQEEGKQLAQKLLDKKLNKCDIVQQIKSKQPVPNPHFVGELCQIIGKGDPELKKFSGCWCIIIEVNTYSCAVQTYRMDFPAVKLENLEPVYTPNEPTAAKNCDRIRRLTDEIYKDFEPTHAAVVEVVGRLADPGSLTSKQERILAFLENEYNL